MEAIREDLSNRREIVNETVSQALRSQCGMANVAMHFEKSDVVISPFELDHYREEQKLDHARGRISREAGDLIVNKVEEREPVSLYSGETRFARLFYPDEGLELGMEDAYIKLFDELQIAQHVEINKTFSGSQTVGDIIDYIFEQIEKIDEHNILTSWKPTEPDIPDEEVYTVAGMGGILDKLPGDSLSVSLTSKARNRYDFLTDDVDFDFEEQNALSVLNEIAKELGIDIFTRDDGIMWVGSQEDNVDFYTASFPRSTYNMINYSVPAGNNNVKGIIVEGDQMIDFSLEGLWDLVTGEDSIFMNGIAVRNDIEEGEYLWTEYNSRNPATLRQVAQNKLEQTVAQTQSGNAEIDLLSTDFQQLNQPDMRRATIDDVLLVPNHTGTCQNIVPGAYFINRIHHQINPRQGWVINLGIRGLITQEIDTGAFGLNADTGEIVEQIQLSDLYWGTSSTIEMMDYEIDLDTSVFEDSEDEL